MKAAAIDRFGPPSVLAIHTLPVPQPGSREILIALHSAGVGVWDADIRDGSWQPAGRPKFPLVPGMDGAGVVVATGARVRRIHIGDEVWAMDYANAHNGFYAEYIAVDDDHAARKPRRLDLLHAGAAVTTGLTALHGIDNVLHVKRGETVFIFGASGAVGTLAIQFAKRKKACVLATASGRQATTSSDISAPTAPSTRAAPVPRNSFGAWLPGESMPRWSSLADQPSSHFWI